MKKTVVLLVLAFLAVSAQVYAFGGCEEDCQKCHTLGNDEAKQILAKLKATDAKVLDIKMSPIRGLWEVAIEDKGTRGIVYVGFSKKFVMAGPIIEVETVANKTQESLGELNRAKERYVDVSKISREGSLLLGDKEAPIKAFVFTDPDCPFCGKFHGELKKVVNDRKDIAFYLILMPLKFHPDAYWKAKSIICSHSLTMLEDNFEKRQITKNECDTEAIDSNIKLAAELGITGTPTLIMPDGLVMVGLQDSKTLEAGILKHIK